jgi:hypothetical protein
MTGEQAFVGSGGPFGGVSGGRVEAPFFWSVFGEVHAPLATRLSIGRIMATSMKVSLLCTIRS